MTQIVTSTLSLGIMQGRTNPKLLTSTKYISICIIGHHHSKHLMYIPSVLVAQQTHMHTSPGKPGKWGKKGLAPLIQQAHASA